MTKGEKTKIRGRETKRRETKIVKKGKKHKDILIYDIGGEI